MGEPAWKSISIDVGYEYWDLLDGSYERYSSFDKAEEAAIAKGMKAAKNAVEHHPPLTIREAINRIKEAERIICGISEEDQWSVGPWDEYFQSSPPFKPQNIWPRGTISVVPMRGSNEGIYLRIRVYDETRHEAGYKTIVTGKTCEQGSEAWQKCWESAMRISWYLTCW